MNASELKYKIESADPTTNFFDRKTMKFFGDTMRNFGVTKTTVKTYDGETVEVYELYRKRPTKAGSHSYYFDRTTFSRVYKAND